MTSIQALNRYENQLAFELLAEEGFNPESNITVSNINIDLNENADDVVMLNGNNININANAGNNLVYLSGENNHVRAGNGSNQIALWGKNSTAIAGDGNDFMYAEGENITLTSKNGDNVFRVYGDGNRVFAGAGNDQIGLLGNKNQVVAGDGDNNIGFYGDDNKISTNKGNSAIKTLDFAIIDGDFKDMEDSWIKTLDKKPSTDKELINTTYDYSCCDNAIYTALSQEDLAYAESVDMSKTIKGAYNLDTPAYVIGADAAGYARLYVYSYNYRGVNYYYPVGEEGNQALKTTFAATMGQEASYVQYDHYKVTYKDNYRVDGVSGNQIYFGDGDNVLKYTVADSSNDIDMANAKTGHILIQQTAYTFADTESRYTTEYSVKKIAFFTVANV